LGKEFEATLKAYLVVGISKGKIISKLASDPDKWKLVNMVDCLRENSIVNDQAVLQYLRQERNNRAHGTMPTLAERKVLLNSVQFTAGMYIDYCKLFDEMTVALL
jgi:hypothetical protein